MTLLEKLQQCSSKELIPTPDGAFTVQYEGRFVHSSRSPIKETQKILNNINQFSPNDTLVIVWGAGLGYHIEQLLKQGFDIIVIESRESIANLFLQLFDKSEFVDFITDTKIIFNSLVQISKYYANFVDISLLAYPIPSEAWNLKTQAISAIKSTHQIKCHLVESWYINILQNLQAFNLPHIGYTFDSIFEGQELIICSAGPSLKESLPFLKKHSKNTTILTVDTSLLSLLDADIIPDYVHAVDAKIHNIFDFRGISESIFNQITLIADITLSPQIVNLPWKEVLFVSTVQIIETKKGIEYSRHSLQQYLWDNSICLPETQTGGSVATSAFHLGILYKADKILLIGQDLAYTNHRGHAVGSPYDKEYRLKTSRLNSLDTIHIHKTPFNEKAIKGIKSPNVYADPLLQQFRSWFEVSIKDNPRLKSITINASEDGAYFDNWNHTPLSNYTPKIKQKTKTYKKQKFTKNIIDTIIQQLKNLSIDEEHPVLQDYFYREKYFNTEAPKIQKKKARWKKHLNHNKY